ncbi:MAG: division/cell wall cluster transcriptional repressor MraZ [Bacteroidales bacterium]|nr:division/cell wall cluster transcriptional repressor MraZ [Bacteroidales bacterium]
MATFIGDYSCKIDAKGRLIFPSAFKKQMRSVSLDHFVVRRDIFEQCLVLYTSEDWDEQMEQIRSRINPYNREHNMFMRNFFKGTAELTIDSSNRLLIPRRLIEVAGIKRDVVLAGQDGRIEIWAAEKYEEIDMPVDDFADLAEKLMGGKLPEEEL